MVMAINFICANRMRSYVRRVKTVNLFEVSILFRRFRAMCVRARAESVTFSRRHLMFYFRVASNAKTSVTKTMGKKVAMNFQRY